MVPLLILLTLFAVSCSRTESVNSETKQTYQMSHEDSVWTANNYAELGFDQYSYEEYEAGLKLFKLALQFDSTHSQAWHGKALMLDNLGQDENAAHAYRQAEKYDSSNKQAIFHLGCLFARAGEKENALRQLRTVIALDSSYAIGVQTESCWTSLWSDIDFLETVGVIE